MYVNPINLPQIPAVLPDNPTDSQRRELLYNSLAVVGRTDDYQNIIEHLSPPEIIDYGHTGEFKGIKVGIIGGGLAGMAAAFELRKLGYDITIYEPNTGRVGGRVYTYYFDKDKKLYEELGAMRIPLSHETTWHYINIFKLETEASPLTGPNTFTMVRNVRVRNTPDNENIFHKIYPLFDLSVMEANIPWPEIYIKANWYYLSTMPPDIRKQLIMIMSRYDYRHELLGRLSLREALERYGLSNEAVNMIASLMPQMETFIYSSYESILAEEYSMDFLNLYHIKGGMANLPLSFYESLTSPNPEEYSDIPPSLLGKVNWRGGSFIAGIYKSDSDGKVVLKYRMLSESGKDYFENYDYVICAVPFPVLREISIVPEFSGKKMQAIREIIYIDAQKTLFLCKERFWERQGIFQGSSLTDSIIQTIMYPPVQNNCIQNSADCHGERPGVLVASYNSGYDAIWFSSESQERQYEIITREIERVHRLPAGYLNNIVMDVKRVDWIREPWSYGAFHMFLPGQKKDFSYFASIPEYDNRVFFAGEHTSTKSAWMQGALQCGMIAAQDVAYYSIIHKHQK